MILVRHGESEFNVHFSKHRVDPGIEDPGLTERGRQQAREAAEALAGYDIDTILTSPYRRTLETTAVIAERLGRPVVVEPLVRERGHFACDIGTPRSVLGAAWPQHDFSHLDEIWWHEKESDEMLAGRCDAFCRLATAHEAWPRLLVVAHWGFIRALTGVPLGNGEIITFDPTREERRERAF